MIYKKRKKMEEEEERVREIQNKRRLKGDRSNDPNCPELGLFPNSRRRNWFQ